MKKPMSFVTRVVPGNMKIRLAYLVLLFAGAAVIYGCAKVKVRKVPTPTQYVRWTDAQQRKADNMEGIRFYLPRPFVCVFESFPIRTDIYLANGMVSPDGKYVVVTSVTAESGLSRYVATDPRHVEIPTSFIFDPKRRESEIKAQSLALGTALETISTIRALKQAVPTGIKGTPPTAQLPPPPPPPPSVEPTGISKRKVTNDNGAFAYQPLRGNFDLVYLPDFEEQYVVSETAGLGNAMFAINLGQGWSLQGFDSLVDNSQLNQRIFNLIDTAIRLAQGAASAATGIPLVAPGAGEPGVIRPQSKQEAMDREIPGTPVTLKIVVVHYAAKGLYPVIKPRELQERALSQTESHGILDLFRLFPQVDWASSYDPTAITRAQQAIDNQTGSFTVPRYPYQYLSFNTFRYMAIEVVQPTSDQNPPFKYQYDRTGVTGDIGDARTGEINKVMEDIIRLLGGKGDGKGKTDSDSKPLDERLQTLAAALPSELELKLNEATIKVEGASHKGDGKFEVMIGEISGTPTDDITQAKLEEELLGETRKLAEKQGYLPKAEFDASKEVKRVSVANFAKIEARLKKGATGVTGGLSEAIKARLDDLAAKLQSDKTKITLKGLDIAIATAKSNGDGTLDVTVNVSGTREAGAKVARDKIEDDLTKKANEIAVNEQSIGLPDGTVTGVKVTNFDAVKAELGH